MGDHRPYFMSSGGVSTAVAQDMLPQHRQCAACQRWHGCLGDAQCRIRPQMSCARKSLGAASNVHACPLPPNICTAPAQPKALRLLAAPCMRPPERPVAVASSPAVAAGNRTRPVGGLKTQSIYNTDTVQVGLVRTGVKNRLRNVASVMRWAVTGTYVQAA